MNLLRHGFRKLSSDIHTYRQTDRQTDGTEMIYHAAGWSTIIIFFTILLF